jgi:hypothetical protein
MYHNFKLKLIKLKKQNLKNYYKFVFSKKKLNQNKKTYANVGLIKAEKIFLNFKTLGKVFFKGAHLTKGIQNKLFRNFLNKKFLN